VKEAAPEWGTGGEDGVMPVKDGRSSYLQVGLERFSGKGRTEFQEGEAEGDGETSGEECWLFHEKEGEWSNRA